MDTKRYDLRYKRFFGEGGTNCHEHPESLSNGRLVAELDDIVQVLAMCENAEYTELQSTEPGRAYLHIKHELSRRLAWYTADPTGAELIPGSPDKCPGNGSQPGQEICCDECAFYQECWKDGEKCERLQ